MEEADRPAAQLLYVKMLHCLFISKGLACSIITELKTIFAKGSDNRLILLKSSTTKMNLTKSTLTILWRRLSNQ